MDKVFQKILVIQLKRAGDVLVTTPIPTLLKQQWPHAQIDFLVMKPFASLLENHPALHRIHIYDTNHPFKTAWMIRQQHYDAIFDFQSSPRSAWLTVLSGASVTAGYQVTFWGNFYRYSVPRPGKMPVTEGKVSLLQPLIGSISTIPPRQLYLMSSEKESAKNQLRCDDDSRPIIGIIPTHRQESRRWEMSSFAKVAQQLTDEGFRVLLFWGPGEKEEVEALQKQCPKAECIPPTSFRQMAALLENCQLVITNDNGPMHLAVSVGTPTLTIYGPTDPESWNPGGSHHQVLQAQDVSCLGCNLNHCPFQHECMSHVSPMMVMQRIHEVLERIPA